MAIAFVQKATAIGEKTSSTVLTLPANPGAGNALFVVLTSGSTAISSISGGGVTWALIKQSAVNFNLEIWAGLNSSGSGTSITITMSAKASHDCNCYEYSGLLTASATDVTASNSGSSANPATGNLVTTNAADLLLAAFCFDPGRTRTAGPTNSFTLREDITTGSVNDASVVERVVSATATYSTGITLDATNLWDAVFIAMKGPASGGGLFMAGGYYKVP